MRKLMLNTYLWVAVAFYVVALADLANDGSIWIVWFALGMVFTIIAFRRPKPEPHPETAEQKEKP
ncbi:hypothetical protein [Pseudoclavibacter sp. 8L]|uniref:hypothetical protein n=1 Tax=Pseudoclavibacter sp. 8L TaxID=2653162 RepID=UPI001357752F|nr:hypothetical protein [Pseudoclavibacter sp. 8L]